MVQKVSLGHASNFFPRHDGGVISVPNHDLKKKRTPCVPRRVICRPLLRQLQVVRKIVRSHLIQLTTSAGVVAFMWSRFGIKFDSKQNQYSNL